MYIFILHRDIVKNYLLHITNSNFTTSGYIIQHLFNKIFFMFLLF